MRKAKSAQKSAAQVRREARQRDLNTMRRIMDRHLAVAWNEAAEYVAKVHPNRTVRQFNNDFADELLGQFNKRRDWSKVLKKVAQ